MGAISKSASHHGPPGNTPVTGLPLGFVFVVDFVVLGAKGSTQGKRGGILCVGENIQEQVSQNVNF